LAASQIETLRLFTALRLHRPVWAGSLVLGIGLNDTGRALALASLAAGAACLLLEDDPALLREASREGCATFTVTTLDEALRALKNEVRQGRAITVALGGSTDQWLAEMVERGVLPQSIAAARELSGHELASLTTLKDWGAERLSGLGLLGSGAVDLAQLLRKLEGTWEVAEHVVNSHVERRQQDLALLDAAAGDHPVFAIQQQWLRAAPTLFPRARNRPAWSMKPQVPGL
jgi:hypothetical protein